MTSKKKINERELLLLLRRGDRVAFEHLYHEYASRLTVKLLQLVKVDQLAQDLLQDIFLKVWQMHEQIDPERSFGALLYTIATNLSINTYRNNIRAKQNIIHIAQNESYTHIEENIQYQETNKLWNEALATLTARQKEVYILHKIEGKSYKEIAETLEISNSAINQHLQLANKHIRTYMLSRLPELLLILLPLVIEH